MFRGILNGYVVYSFDKLIHFKYKDSNKNDMGLDLDYTLKLRKELITRYK